MSEQHNNAEDKPKLTETQQKAWWRGYRVRTAGHDLKWYSASIAKYTDTEREAFFKGYNS